MENGANSVRALCTHAVLSGPAYERIANSDLTEIVLTDTIPLDYSKNTEKIKIVSTDDLFAKSLDCLVNHKSISDTLLLN